VGSRDLSRDAEPEPRAIAFGRALAPKERLEDGRPLILVDARPLIGDRDANHAVLERVNDSHDTSRRRVSDRVLEDIPQHPGDVPIPIGHPAGRASVDRDRHTSLTRGRIDQRERVAQRLRERNGLGGFRPPLMLVAHEWWEERRRRKGRSSNPFIPDEEEPDPLSGRLSQPPLAEH
jgi:hypothetical protein